MCVTHPVLCVAHLLHAWLLSQQLGFESRRPNPGWKRDSGNKKSFLKRSQLASCVKNICELRYWGPPVLAYLGQPRTVLWPGTNDPRVPDSRPGISHPGRQIYSLSLHTKTSLIVPDFTIYVYGSSWNSLLFSHIFAPLLYFLASPRLDGTARNRWEKEKKREKDQKRENYMNCCSQK